MKLKELINIEENLLIFEEQYKFNLSVQDYIILNNCLNNIGEITSIYFKLIESYHNELINEKSVEIDIKTLLKEYNDKLLCGDILCDVNDGLNIINKYKNNEN